MVNVEFGDTNTNEVRLSAPGLHISIYSPLVEKCGAQHFLTRPAARCNRRSPSRSGVVSSNIGSRQPSSRGDSPATAFPPEERGTMRGAIRWKNALAVKNTKKKSGNREKNAADLH
jgi:hypothetical protein